MKITIQGKESKLINYIKRHFLNDITVAYISYIIMLHLSLRYNFGGISAILNFILALIASNYLWKNLKLDNQLFGTLRPIIILSMTLIFMTLNILGIFI